MSVFDLDSILKLLETANQQGVNIAFANEELSVRFEKGKKIDKSLLEELKLNKPFLVHYFKTHASKGNKSTRLSLLKTARNESDEMPLSYAQERLWFIDQLEGSVQYHIPAVLRLTGDLNIDALTYAIQQIINRHEVLRTVIRENEGKASQFINPKNGWQLNVQDGSMYAGDETILQAYIQQLINAPFDLSTDYMIRANLLMLGSQSHVLVVTLHHIASDGWSTSIIVRELVALYNAFEKGDPDILPPLEIQYADFAAWQRQYLQGELLEQKLAYWKNKLQDVSTLQLPGDYERPPIQSTRGDAIQFRIDNTVTDQLLSISQQQGATLFMTLLAAFNILLNRYTGQEDICVGTPIAGRDQQEVESLIGFFINSLALRNNLAEDSSFTGFLSQVKTTTLEAYDHKELPFEKVVEAVVSERNLGRSPIFQVMFVLQNTPPVPRLRLGEVELSVVNFDNFTSKYDLAFLITETANGLHCGIRYCTDIFKESTILRLAGHFQQLLISIVQDPGQSIRSLPMLSVEEEEELLVGFNNTKTPYPTGHTIIDLFEQRVNDAPDAIAIVSESGNLSYAILNEGSNQLAGYLKAKGIAEGSLVALAMDRSLDMLVGIMGILKAGAGYVPLDIAYPAERLKFMLEDTAVQVIVTDSHVKDKIPLGDTVEVICLDTDWMEISKYSGSNAAVPIGPHSIAYIIYTSGSTGKPKGVIVEHGGVVNLALSQAEALRLTPQTATLQFASVGFDASCYEIFNTLLSGGKLVLPKKEDLSTAENFEAFINKHGVDLAVLPPTFLQVIKNSLGTLKTIVSAGEALNEGIAKEIQSKGIRLINAYGPTENTVCTTLTDNPVIEDDTVVIGKPISNVQVYLLDSWSNPVAVGVLGELCIGGSQLARGYLNRRELTAEKFILNPFDATGSTRLYRSGDLARWLPDGNIVYLGRIDDQVKLRGYRVELGEIESCLLQSGLVSQAVVLLREDIPGTKRLAGYVVAAGDFDKEGLIAFLQDRLPEYMIPSAWVALDHLPLTPNGKIDRKALPAPDAPAVAVHSYTAARNETELQLTSVWQELLHIPQVSIDDNFFELGGDSILTIQVVSRCRRQGLQLQPRDLFIHQTIRRLSEAIAQRSSGPALGEQGVLTGEAGLLPIQRWYLEAGQRGISHFNQGVLLGLDKSVTLPLLEEAIAQLVIQHDALRFRYSRDEEGRWQQEYGIYKGIVDAEDLRDIPKEDLSAAITKKAALSQQELDIYKGELVKVVWMQTPDTASHNRLLIIIHHLAVDGVSWRILLGDLELLLTGLLSGNAVQPGAKSSSYRQWYKALETYGKSRRLLSQLPYWQQAALGYEPLRTDKEYSGKLTDKDITRHTLRLDETQTSRLLQEVPRVYHTEINDLLLAALAATLGDWTGREQVNIGLEGHGREDIAADTDISRTVGWFTSLYPLPLSLKNTTTPGALVKSIKEQLRALPGKGLGYGVLKYINAEPTLQGDQPWDIVFNYLGQLDTMVRESKLFSGAGESQGAGRSREQEVTEKISVNSFVRGGELIIAWNYSSLHYEAATIEQLSQAYLQKLQELIGHCVTQEQESGVVYTPSDYGLGGEIGYEELDAFLAVPVNGRPRGQQITGLYRLSGLQEGMLFHGMYDTGIGAYIEQFGCDLSGVNLEVLKKSFAGLMDRHTILRSAFYVDAFRVPVQCVYREVSLPVTVLDYRDLSREEQEAAIKAYYVTDKQKGFDFTTAPLMRVGLFRLTEDRYRMVWTLHHILFDGWSLSVLMEEFLNSYELLLAGENPGSIEEDRYEDYIRYIERTDKEEEEAYWRHYLEGVSEHTLLPFISPTADRNKGAGHYHMLSLQITGEQVAGIHAFTQRHHITVNTLVQGVWAYLLHRYTGNENIVYGVVVSGRPDDLGGIEQRVGMYINTLPLHSRMEEGGELVSWLQGIQSEQVSSRQYQHTPLQQVQGWSGIQGDLFDTLLTFENYPVSKVIASRQSALNVGNVSMQEQTNYPLSIIIGSSEQINVHFSYNTTLLDQSYVASIRDHFEHVLLQVVSSQTSRISDIRLLTTAQQQQVVEEFNNTATAFNLDKNVVELFEEQVSGCPGSIALVFKEAELSYAELNGRSNQLAHYLRAGGVGAESLVPVCMERSIEMMVAILGILKAGGAYVPIDPAYPADRISYMLEDTAATLVLTTTKSREQLPMGGALEILVLDEASGLLEQYPSTNLSEPISSSQLAYVIYTSGSTGKPKGVMIEHRNLANLVQWHNKKYSVGNTSRGTVMAGVGFDALGWEIWPYFSAGARLVIINDETRFSAKLLSEALATHEITHSFIATALIPDFITENLYKKISLRYVLTGGDKLPGVDTTGLSYALVNNYGPTENTVVTSSYELVPNSYNSVPPIGKPISNTVTYLLDKQQQLVPAGVSGEIYIGGAGLGRGYLNLPGLTTEKFITDFISKVPGQRLYRSGDLGRWLPDGNIEYLGRTDEQVKIRGFRIELGEIEQELLASGLVKQCIVLAKTDNLGNKKLVAYIIVPEKLDKNKIIEYLKEKVPDYMIPSLWIPMESFPVTSNGKLDKKALPDIPAEDYLTAAYVAPRSATEEKLAEIWKELLQVDKVGVYDNFFELGGHSLMAMRMVAHIERIFLVSIPIKVLFQFTCINDLSKYLAIQANPSEEENKTSYTVFDV